jgi:hypothetical protein
VNPEQLARATEVGRSPDCVSADEDGFLRAPEGRLPPAEAVDHTKHLERRPGNALKGHPEERHLEALGQRCAIPLVPVEELNDTGRLAERAHALLHPLCIHRIDEPDAFTREQRM